MSASTPASLWQKLLKRLLTPPVFDDEEKTRAAQIVHFILVSMSAAIMIFTITAFSQFLSDSNPNGLSVIGILIIFVVVAWYLFYSGHIRGSAAAFVGIIWLATTVGTYAYGGIQGTSPIFFPIIILVAGLTLGNRSAVICALLSIVVLTGTLFADQQGLLPSMFSTPSVFDKWLSLIIAVSVASVLLYVATTSINRALLVARRNAVAMTQSNLELQSIRESLERRVTERTAQLQANADVGRAASSILDLEQLAHEMVNLIGERFNFYYAAIFVVDASGRWAVLREATGEAGQLLKAQGYKLEVGDQSMVGYATGQRKSRIALDVGADAVRFANPLLPYSRSEMVLPLTVGDRVIGALDVQSTKSAAFDESATTSLQGLADQIAVAINNAQQYQREQARAEQTGRLLQATLELTAQTDRAAMEEQLVQLAVSQFDAAGAQLWSKFDGQLVLKAARSSAPVSDARLPGQNLIERVFNTGLTVRTDNAADQVDSAADTARQSAVVAPIIWQEKVTSVLSITRVQPFSQDDESSIQLLAAQAAATVENIALAEQQRRTLEELNVVNRQLTGEAWQAQTSEQELAYVYHQPGTSKEDQNQRLAEIPIELHGQPIGAISFQDTSDHQALTEDEHAIIRAVVQQMGLVLENQRLAEVAQRAAQRDRVLAAAADQIHRPTDLDAVLRVAAEELGRIAALSEIGIQLGFTSVEPDGNGDQPPARG